MTSSGVDVVCWGDAVEPVMWLIDLFCGSESLVVVAVSAEYDVRASSRISVWLMYVCHVGWTRMDDCVRSLGSLQCGVLAGSKSVVLRVSMLVRSWRSEACGPLIGSLASIASVFRMCNCIFDGDNLMIVSIVLHLRVPVAHNGG